MEKVKSPSQDKVKIKFNCTIYPKMQWNEKSNKYESLIPANKDFRLEYLKLVTGEGDTPEETALLKAKNTAALVSRGLLTAEEITHFFSGDPKETFYHKDEVVTLPKKDAEYYLTNYCGGDITVPGATKELKQTHHLKNIDDMGQFYSADQMHRFEREHKPIPLAEIYNG